MSDIICSVSSWLGIDLNHCRQVVQGKKSDVPVGVGCEKEEKPQKTEPAETKVVSGPQREEKPPVERKTPQIEPYVEPKVIEKPKLEVEPKPVPKGDTQEIEDTGHKEDVLLALVKIGISCQIGFLNNPDCPFDMKAKIVDGAIRYSIDENEDNKKAAALALLECLAGNINIPSVLKVRMIEPFIKLLKDRKEEVRKIAITALGNLIYREVPFQLIAKAFDSLLSILQEDEVEIIQNQGAYAIKQIVLYILIAKDASPEQKSIYIKPLIGVLKHKNGFVRKEIADALGSYCMKDVDIPIESRSQLVMLFIEALQDKDEDVRFSAAVTLRNLVRSNVSLVMRTKTVTPLITALTDEYENVRTMAAGTLGLLALLDISPELKTQMIDPLLKFVQREKFRLGLEAREVAETLGKALSHLISLGISSEQNDKIIHVILNYLKEEDKGVRMTVLILLRQFDLSSISSEQKDRLVEALIKTLGDKDGEIRQSAILSLEEFVKADIDSELKIKIVDVFIKALRDVDRGVRLNATASLDDHIKDIPLALKIKIIDSLIGTFHDNDSIVRSNAWKSLITFAVSNIPIKQKVRIVDMFIKALKDKKSGVRETTIYALKSLGKSDIPSELKAKIQKALEKAEQK